MLALDWAATPLGPPVHWSQGLRAAIATCISSQVATAVLWGERLVLLHNDACRALLGDRHPAAVGRPLREAWPELWPVVGAMVDAVRRTGAATWCEDRPLEVQHGGEARERHVTIACSPLWEDGAVAGALVAITDTTRRVLDARRLRTLRALADRTAACETVDDAVAAASDVLADDAHDLPFALTYLRSAERGDLRRAGVAGLPWSPGTPLDDGDAWPFERAASSGAPETVTVLPPGVAAAAAIDGVAPRAAIVHAMAGPDEDGSIGFLVAGVQPRRAPDDDERRFVGLLAARLATAIAAARAREAERERAEALAELDRSKTALFGNVSHEFRTPLTLMLGSIEDALGDEREPLGPRQRARIDTAARNAERLLKLVNVLLDFTRLQAGRLEAVYEPTDLARLTAELASIFRAAAERAGLRLVVDCPPLDVDVYVDRDMWETIVLNLLSNALKFTFEGEIAVTLRSDEGRVKLRVADTGTGISPQELPRLVERFHRVADVRARTTEGSGIGLALVDELVRLHGGEVAVDSAPGLGTTFAVSLPLGAAHLPGEHVRDAHEAAPRTTDAWMYLDETLQLLPDDDAAGDGAIGPEPPPSPGAARVLVVDDSADLRAYLRGLLSPHWAVEVAPDGEAALAAALRSPPDLVLTDVMMPRLDGFGLLRALRADPRTARIPIIMLSARAGEESSLRGLDAGADDYLVKPFSARELVARVRVHLALSQAREQAAAERERAVESERERAATARFWLLAEMTSDFVGIADADGRARYVNAAGRRLLGYDEETDLSDTVMIDYVAPSETGWFADEVIPAAIRDGIWRGETPLRHRDGHEIPVSQVIVVHHDAVGDVDFLATIARDISAEREAARRLRDAEQHFRHAFDDAPVGMAMVEPHGADPGTIRNVNPALCRLLGLSRDALPGTALRELVHPEESDAMARQLERLARGELDALSLQTRLVRGDGGSVAVAVSASAAGHPGGGREILVHVQDITERKRLEERLRGLADHDPLTGLPNRRRFAQELAREVAAVRRYGRNGALLVIDLDDFKIVNDSLGHAAGDELLVRAGRELRKRLRTSDTLARLGGDEFAVIVPYADEPAARRVAEGLLVALREGAAVSGGGGARRLTASIGIALLHGRDAPATSDDLLMRADIAMYDAKESGRNAIAVFDPRSERQRGMERRLSWAERIRGALADDRFVLHAQPIVRLAGDGAPRYELLVRMRGDDGELILPEAFLDAAEQFDLVQAIDLRVVSAAIGLLADAQRERADVVFEVNISAKSLLDPDLPDVITALLASAGADGRGLVFEVTETAAVVNFDDARRFARRLAEVGCRFALDDFGAGYCSFHYIKRLAFDYLKIDGEFVKDLATSETNQLVVRAVVDIARGLGKRTVAEFVDSAETVALLARYGVDYAQGFHIARPAAVEQLDLTKPVVISGSSRG